MIMDSIVSSSWDTQFSSSKCALIIQPEEYCATDAQKVLSGINGGDI